MRIDRDALITLEEEADEAIACNETSEIIKQMDACTAWGAVIYRALDAHSEEREQIGDFHYPELARQAYDLLENSNHATLVALRALYGRLQRALGALAGEHEFQLNS